MLEKFFFLDVNGKDLARDRYGTWEKMRALSRKLNRPLVAGSDTHQSFQYGCVWNEFERTVSTVDGLAGEITKGAYETFKVESAGILKRALKEIDALGGDYVSVLLKGAEI